MDAEAKKSRAARAGAEAAGGGAPAIDAAKVPAGGFIAGLTVKALKEQLGRRGLAVGGKKGELVARLTETLDAAAGTESTLAAGEQNPAAEVRGGHAWSFFIIWCKMISFWSFISCR